MKEEERKRIEEEIKWLRDLVKAYDILAGMHLRRIRELERKLKEVV